MFFKFVVESMFNHLRRNVMRSEKELLKEIEALIAQKFKDNPEELKRLKEESKKMASEKEHERRTALIEDATKMLFEEVMLEKTDVEKVKAFIKAGADVNSIESEYQATLLHFAMAKNDVNLVKTLVEAGANINFQNSQRTAPIHTGIYNDSLESIKFLIESGADVNLFQMDGFSSLHCAVIRNNFELVKILVNGGADVNIFDINATYQGSALHWAATLSNTEIAEFLIESGANVNAKNKFDNTPMNWAMKNGNREMLEMFERNGGISGVNF